MMDKLQDYAPDLSGSVQALGILGGMISAAFGGWSTGIAALLICMGVDYITGLVVAGVFHASKKSANGTLDSRVGWKGLCRKGMTLLMVLIAAQLDLVIGVDFIRDAVVIAYIANEVLSIIENAGLMGVPVTPALARAIEILQSRAEDTGEK